MNNRILALVLLGSLAATVGCSSKNKTNAMQPETAGTVSVAKAVTVRVPDAITSVGTVRAADTAQLSAQMMGTILAVNVREGDAVRRGQVLVQIDPAQSQAALDRAQAALAASQHEVAAAQTQKTLAESTLARFDILAKRKSVSPQEYDEVKARAQSASASTESAQAAQAQAKAAVAQAQSAFEYTHIRAPFDGLVIERRVDPGALASPGMPLLTVEASGRFRLETTVNEANIATVKMGENVPVSFDVYPDQRMSGKVVQIVPAADPASRTFVVKIELPVSPLLRSGLFGRAQFADRERSALVIPRAALIERGSLKGVFVIGQNNIASLRYVTVGNPQGDGVEVLSGLSESEPVVVTPANRDLGGKRVEVQ